MNYYEHVATLPPELLEIHEYCWDVTGRPNFERSYQVAIGRLCEISNDWEQFHDHCDKFFFNKEGVREMDLDIAWHCYIKGMTVLAEKLSKGTPSV